VRQPAELQEAVRAIGLQLVVLTATNAGDIEAAFMTMVQNRVGALLVGSDPFFVNRREQIVALASAACNFQRLPVVRWLGPMAS
jgi:ABC-type uncharacterized transport system substrate-binding protein